MGAKKSTVIWLQIVELNYFPEYLKTKKFKEYKMELINLMAVEMEKEKKDLQKK